MNSSIFRKTYDLIKEADANGLLIEDLKLSGLSGNKIIGALQRLSVLQSNLNACYLEVGVFQGLTLLSVAKALKNEPAYGIDNFHQFDPDKKNLSIVNERMRLLGIQNAFIINMDYEDALENLGKYIGDRKVGVYFVDGPHDYRSQLMCLQLVKSFLSENAMIVVDDCNYRHVRRANRDFLITNPEFKLIFEAYTRCHPGNMTRQEKIEAIKGWWNGVNIIVKDQNNQLQPMYPPTVRSRHLYENEHIVHAARFAEYSPDAIRLVSSLWTFNILKFAKDILRLFHRVRRIPPEAVEKFESMNTFSDNLPDSNYNPSLT